MIDWLTIRVPLNAEFSAEIHARLRQFIGHLTNVASSGEVMWTKPSLDIDALRSDTPGLCWSVVGDGEQYFLSIGASPASLEFGVNVFGSSDIRHCAMVLKHHAERALSCILPPLERWQCRRIDITHNYKLDGLGQVQQALRELRKGDGVRQKATVPKGDTVVWGQGSDLMSGKAYAKGPQLRYLQKKRKDMLEVSDEYVELAESLLRFELSLRARWFRRHGNNWLNFSEDYLNELHGDFFGRFVGGVEVCDMGTLLMELERVAPSKGQALAAHRTWAMVKSIGYEMAKVSMPKATWCRHVKFLRAAGVSQADLVGGVVIPFRRDVIVLSAPVTSWDELRRAA